MKIVKRTVVVIILVLISGMVLSTYDYLAAASPSRDSELQQSVQLEDKSDGECTGQETVGRCADKCPANTEQGAYFLRGFDKETGAAVCGFSWYDACPYTEAVPRTDPMCEKARLNQEAQVITPDDPQYFVGK